MYSKYRVKMIKTTLEEIDLKIANKKLKMKGI